MAELEKFFPKGMAWDVPYDSSRFVDISINEVVITLFEAMLLVFLVMYLFLENLRATLIPAVVVPVALTGAMIGLYLFGYSINVLTLFAMVLAIGIVVDDAIVVVENVERIMSEEARAARRHAQGDGSDIFRRDRHHLRALRRVPANGVLWWSCRRHLSTVFGDAAADDAVFRTHGADADAGDVRDHSSPLPR